MSAQFLQAFVNRVLHELLKTEQIEIAPGSESKIVAEVGAVLGTARQGSSLISTLVAALIASPHVEELYADNDEIKDMIVDLGL